MLKTAVQKVSYAATVFKPKLMINQRKQSNYFKKETYFRHTLQINIEVVLKLNVLKNWST